MENSTRSRKGEARSAVRPRRVALATMCAAALVTAACSGSGDEQPPGDSNPTEGVVTLPPKDSHGQESGGGQSGQLAAPPAGQGARPTAREAVPSTKADCPYLSADEAGDATGEKVTRVDIDPSFDPPACFFTTIDGSVSLITTKHETGSEAEARALVDDAAPPATTERADVAGGWTGGKSTGSFGALLAVARGSDVVVVQSTQDRSMAVQRVADLVVPRLGN